MAKTSKEETSKAEVPATRARRAIPRRPYNKGGSQRFEMFLPYPLVEDLNRMKAKTGNSFAAYIRAATERALSEDKARWDSD